jgi:hypothetical protein
MTIKQLITAIALAFVLLMQSKVIANAQDITCTVVYGQGEVCGVATTEEPVVEHEPVVAGVGDVDFSSLALAFSLLSAGLFIVAVKNSRNYFFEK